MFDASRFADRAPPRGVLNAHHYNARIQHTVESARHVDGRAIVERATEAAFAPLIAHACREGDELATRHAVAQHLYAHLGYGWYDLTGDGAVSTASHFVEGWLAGFPGAKRCACTFTSAYLSAAHAVATGELVEYIERACMVDGARACRFERVPGRTRPLATHRREAVPFAPRPAAAIASNIDAQAIRDAVAAMPIRGNSEGLIPAFNVYLASTPADFYNRMCIDFVSEMTAAGLGRHARQLLVDDAETCGMTTFRGIMGSPEWAALVAPMVLVPDDNLFGLVAVADALGWGSWHVTEHVRGQRARLESVQGYEALGYRAHAGAAQEPACLMLAGVAAGIMELIYATGSLDERFGTFAATEHDCIACERGSCTFTVEKS